MWPRSVLSTIHHTLSFPPRLTFNMGGGRGGWCRQKHWEQKHNGVSVAPIWTQHNFIINRCSAKLTHFRTLLTGRRRRSFQPDCFFLVLFCFFLWDRCLYEANTWCPSNVYTPSKGNTHWRTCLRGTDLSNLTFPNPTPPAPHTPTPTNTQKAWRASCGETVDGLQKNAVL